MHSSSERQAAGDGTGITCVRNGLNASNIS